MGLPWLTSVGSEQVPLRTLTIGLSSGCCCPKRCSCKYLRHGCQWVGSSFQGLQICLAYLIHTRSRLATRASLAYDALHMIAQWDSSLSERGGPGGGILSCHGASRPERVAKNP